MDAECQLRRANRNNPPTAHTAAPSHKAKLGCAPGGTTVGFASLVMVTVWAALVEVAFGFATGGDEEVVVASVAFSATRRSSASQSTLISMSQPGFWRFTWQEHAPRRKRHASSISASPKSTAG